MAQRRERGGPAIGQAALGEQRAGQRRGAGAQDEPQPGGR
jgi:hypothetical protein